MTRNGFSLSLPTDDPSQACPPADAQGLAIVHAFADEHFAGNPAGVLIRDEAPSPASLSALARQLGLPIISLLTPVAGEADYRIRWFSPNAELDLCGHGTLAAAAWLYRLTPDRTAPWRLDSASGCLHARHKGDAVVIDLPALRMAPAMPETARDVTRALGLAPEVVLQAQDDIVAVLGNAGDVIAHRPDIQAIAGLPCRGLVITAAAEPDLAVPDGGEPVDIVSRFFAPRIGIDEDAVCVSAHCKLYGYWAARLGREQLRAWQASPAGGRLGLTGRFPRVRISGSARFLGEGHARNPLTPAARRDNPQPAHPRHDVSLPARRA